MLSTEKEVSEATAKSSLATNLIKERDRKRDKGGDSGNERKSETLEKCGVKQQNEATKSFKSTRKKDDSRSSETRNHILNTVLSSKLSENQVPCGESRCYLSRRDENKTDATRDNGEVTFFQDANKEHIFVRETKASRLRAASKFSNFDSEPALSKFPNETRTPVVKKTFGAESHSNHIVKKKEDKSYSRKSYLNRSHTCEGVNDDVYAPGTSDRQGRRRTSTSPSNFSSEKSNVKKFPIYSTMPKSSKSSKNFSFDAELSQTPHASSKRYKNFLKKLDVQSEAGGSLEKSKLQKEKLNAEFLPIKCEIKLDNMTDDSSDRPHQKEIINSTRSHCKNDVTKDLPTISSATKAEKLTASTLKMINRLDEMNKKSKKTQGSSGRTMSLDSPEKSLPTKTVISSDLKSSNCSKENSDAGRHKIEKISLLNSFSKNSVLSSCKAGTSQVKSDDCTKPFSTSLKINKFKNFSKNESVKVEPKNTIESVKPSILKNKMGCPVSTTTEKLTPKPVSILKRKSLSKDESQFSSPPVTFSPCILKKKTDFRRQGILKKRRSLDESEVLRKRSNSSDGNLPDFKPILKTQRPSSMEELRRRSHSPDYAFPQGILKRKVSKEEETEDSTNTGGPLSEPQGILKKKPLPPGNSTQPHVKIIDNVILCAAGGIADIHITDCVRPILKKKSSSEEHSTSDPSLAEVPKSILKKKTSLESEEIEEKPMKPILKSTRVASLDESENVKKIKSLIFTNLDSEPGKPILRKENIRSRNFENPEENEAVWRDVVFRRQDRSHSSSEINCEKSAIFIKRRSLEFQPSSSSYNERDVKNIQTCSSSELSNQNLLTEFHSKPELTDKREKFQEGDKSRENKNYIPYVTLEYNTLSNNTRSSFPSSSEAGEKPQIFVVNKNHSAGKISQTTDSATEHTSGDVLRSTSFTESKKSNDSQNRFDEKVTSLEEHRESPIDLLRACEDSEISKQCSKESDENVSTKNSSLEVSPTPVNHSRANVNYSFSTFANSKSGILNEENPDYEDPLINSCERKIQELTLSDSFCDKTIANSNTEKNKNSNYIHNCESQVLISSISKDMAETNQDAAEYPKSRKEGNRSSILKRHNKKLLDSFGSKFLTQPVSPIDVQLALQKNKNFTEDRKTDEGNYEDELSTLSYRDRLRLFEATPISKISDSVSKIRGSRFRTQPVTTVEVECAKNQRRIQSSASHLHDSVNDNNRSLLKETSPPMKSLKDLTETNDAQNNSSEIECGSDLIRHDSRDSLYSSPKEKKSSSASNAPSKTSSSLLRSKEMIVNKDSASNEEKKVGGLGFNLAAILQKVEQVSSNEKPFLEKPDETSIIKKSLPRHLLKEELEKRFSQPRNNSSIVKSQSHSTVQYAFHSTTNSSKNDSPQLDGVFEKLKKFNKENEDETDEAGSSTLSGLRRSTTQPLRASDDSAMEGDLNGASIQERLARLKKSGELDWQKRRSKVSNVEGELSVITAGNYLFKENLSVMNEKSFSSSFGEKGKEDVDSRKSILADRLGKLDAAKEGWKKRIQPSDAVRFSVEGKMLDKMENCDNSSSNSLSASILKAGRVKRSPKAKKFKSKQCNHLMQSLPSSPTEQSNNSVTRSISTPGDGKDDLSLCLPVFDNLVDSYCPKVTVPKADDETFTSFFNGISSEQMFRDRLDLKDEDLDLFTKMNSSQLLVQKRNIKTQKRRVTVKNPLKTLAARLPSQEYTEIKTGVAQKELKRMKLEKVAKNSNFAIEVLAGLASQEDFTAVTLKKASEGKLSSPDAPYKSLMLLQVKGRRHVQTRLIEPIATNINAGDCFILVAGNEIYHYVGEFSNVIERSRGAEIALNIQLKGDLGCTADSIITISESGRATQEQIKQFWKLLGGEPGCERGAGNIDEDEVFESLLVDTNMVYEVIDDELVPNETFWGSIPKIEILDPNKVLIFDFGSEFYVWKGKNVSASKCKSALKIAKELWEEGYDYSDCLVSPITAASFLGGQDFINEIPDSDKVGSVRPEWALFAKITQNMETILFREKFLDWPDYSKTYEKNKKKLEDDHSSYVHSELKVCDSKAMYENVVPESDLVLEGSHLGRGTEFFDEETRRCSKIATRKVTVWHINEYDYSEVPLESVGHFFEEDSYVVRWHYTITITGRELNGQPSKHLTTGRDRYAYFCWQGQNSPINDKGAAACLTVELDREHGPQVRVTQGFEPPAFLNLFQGRMVVHSGRRFSQVPRNKWRMFICRGETESESVLFEVPCSMRQLRSAASFILINNKTGIIIVWHGWNSCKHTKKVAYAAAKKILTAKSNEFEFNSEDITIREETEGSESQDFLIAVGGDNRNLYFSFLESETQEMKTPRLFHLTSVSGEFHFTEIASPYLRKDLVTSFPFLQSDLYSASQPSLFLLDSSSGLWLWQGWWEGDSESDRGSGNVRFQAERRAAMLTALSYWNVKYEDSPPRAHLIWAGLEPLIFTNQFPFWTNRDDIAEISIKNGRKPGEMVPIKTELESLTQSFYSLSQLQNRPLPNGVNPATLEDYLKPQYFQQLFGLDREEFFRMPSWKKKKLKQEAGLF